MSSETASTAQTASSNETGVSLSSLLLELSDVANTLVHQTRELQRNLKRLATELEREQRRTSRAHKSTVKRTIVHKPVKVNAAMSSFLSAQGVQATDGGYTRQTMMKAISSYIKAKKLQLEENKKEWKADATLVKLFGLEKNKVHTFMRINGLLTRVVVPQ
jgi:chromatin remodeling complex protein RSC6